MGLSIIAAVLGYLLGAIPFGLVLTRMAGLGDIRQVGSGNIGATNVLRTGNKPLALATLLLDAGKGALAVVIARWFGLDETTAMIAGAAAFLGHVFPVWLKFKGGKGVATFIGTVAALCWPVALALVGTWLLVAALFRISSLAALVAALLTPLYAWIVVGWDLSIVCALMAVLIVFRHRENIVRLLQNKEPRIGDKKPV
jgi:acyl phosphate:glycerol-3-phosphate acyltransferase